MLQKNIQILSIDTHSNQCLVTLSNNGILLAAFVSNEQNKHDKLLAEFTRRIILDNNVDIDNLQAISIISGPGSFTGLRIGFALVKGLIMENKVNLIKLPTSEIYAYQAKEFANQLNKQKIISIIPGSSGKYFWQEFDNNANPITGLESVDENMITFYDKFLYVGNFEINNYELHKKMQLNFINPFYLSTLSHKKYLESNFSDPNNFDPDYYFEFIPRTK